MGIQRCAQHLHRAIHLTGMMPEDEFNYLDKEVDAVIGGGAELETSGGCDGGKNAVSFLSKSHSLCRTRVRIGSSSDRDSQPHPANGTGDRPITSMFIHFTAMCTGQCVLYSMHCMHAYFNL